MVLNMNIVTIFMMTIDHTWGWDWKEVQVQQLVKPPPVPAPLSGNHPENRDWRKVICTTFLVLIFFSTIGILRPNSWLFIRPCLIFIEESNEVTPARLQMGKVIFNSTPIYPHSDSWSSHTSCQSLSQIEVKCAFLIEVRGAKYIRLARKCVIDDTGQRRQGSSHKQSN